MRVLIEGRVDALKATHIRWMGTLFAGDYGRAFFDQQHRIGEIHVANNILPEFVEGVTTTLRLGARRVIVEEVGRTEEAYKLLENLVRTGGKKK